MTKFERFEKLKEIIVNIIGVEPEEVTMEASFVEDLGCDSLDTVELVMACEEYFDIEISDQKAESILKVSDALEYIKDNS